MCQAKAFDDVRGDEIYPGTDVVSDADLESYVRSTIHSANALTGSCRMGGAADPLAVLDPQLRVRGVRALRVVDASAIPRIPNGNVHSTVLVFASRAADTVLKER